MLLLHLVFFAAGLVDKFVVGCNGLNFSEGSKGGNPGSGINGSIPVKGSSFLSTTNGSGTDGLCDFNSGVSFLGAYSITEVSGAMNGSNSAGADGISAGFLE